MRVLVVFIALAVVLLPLTANATDVWGDQSGTWTRDNSPYNVIGQIQVPSGQALTIEPGVLVIFQGHYKFIVSNSATLQAVGTESDSIYFTADDPGVGWHGIRLLSANSNSEISYCHLEYGEATGGVPDWRGGAIYIEYCSPTITHNTITDNCAYNGAGIFSYYGSPTISYNYVAHNWARAEGGGVRPWGGDPVISNNIIEENCALLLGGGAIFSSYGNPTISNNLIIRNSSGWEAGGIYVWNESPTVSGNLIVGNSAGYTGGGIQVHCEYPPPAPLIQNNTIYDNFAFDGGGIFCNYSSHPRIENTIIWDNTALGSGSEIYVAGGYPTVEYCDVKGGWSGQGNINVDPVFVGREVDDFSLRWHSPCIDAGVPSINDPDGTRSDMGAFYFDQDVDAIVELYPHDMRVIIPPEGGDVILDGWIFNFLGLGGTADLWTYVFVPRMGRLGPLHLFENIYIPVDSIGSNDITQTVPGFAPGGDYVFVAYLGDYPATVTDSSCLYFTKYGSIPGEASDWSQSNWWSREVTSMESSLPGVYALSQNYPNPFNATTIIHYELPSGGQVNLEVYNMLGQKVATLVDEGQGAGYKTASWDASEVSSGLYFYRLTAGDFTETKRMMLVK